jgi:hypothetical protein
MVPRDERLVENQERFRRANERLHERVVTLARDEQWIPFLCECADEECVSAVHATLGEYAAVRDDDLRFLIVPGHQMIDGEHVVEKRERYNIVEKPAA